MQLMMLEQQNKKRLLQARRDDSSWNLRLIDPEGTADDPIQIKSSDFEREIPELHSHFTISRNQTKSSDFEREKLLALGEKPEA